MLTGAIFGLFTAIIWGIGDFLSRKPSSEIGSYLSSAYVQPVGLILLLAFLAVSGGSNSAGIISAHMPYFFLNLLVGVLGFIGLAFLFKGYSAGVMSVVAPIAGSYPAISVSLSVLLLGTVLTPVRSFAIVGVIAGIILTGVKLSDFRSLSSRGITSESKGEPKKLVKGVDYAIATCLCAGFALFGLGVVSPIIGAILSVVILKSSETVTAFALIIPVAKKFVKPSRSCIGWLSIIGICDALGFLTYNLGVQEANDIPIVVTLSSLLGVVTVILARAFYNERLGKIQALGVGVIFVSVATILYF